MKRIRSILCVICALLLCFALASCSKKAEKSPETVQNDEISGKYEDIVKDSNSDKPIDSGASVFGSGFSSFDFTFTSSDDTIAFSLDKNSFAKLLPGGTFYNKIAPGSEVASYDAGYKTARGLSLVSTAQEFLAKYSIGDENALYIKPGDTLYYNPTNGVFSGRLTALFASEDSVTYKILADDDVQEFLYIRELVSDGTYMDPQEIIAEFPQYSSIVSMDITADETGAVSEVAVYKFDK